MDFKDLDTSLKVTLENITMYSCWLKVNYSSIVSAEKSARSSYITNRIGFIDSNKGAIISFLKKSGLVDAELKPSVWSILLADEKISYPEYCLIHLSKQSLYLGDEPKFNLLNVLLNYITKNSTKSVYSLNDIRALDTDLKPVQNNVNSNRRTDYCMTVLEGTGLFEHVGKIDDGTIRITNNALVIVSFLSTKKFLNITDKINSPERFNRFARFDKDSIAYISDGHPKEWNHFFPHLVSNADFLEENYLNHIIEYATLIQKKHNLILTGAPGTGKTFTAKAIAAEIISDGKSDWSGLTEEQKKQVAFVQFHPSYDYTDFVEGLRPVPGGEFRRQDGAFKVFCKRAVVDSSENGDVKSHKPYIFIIDEINRGELSKIFGELFYAIEPDYRGKVGTVQTQYNNLVEDDDVFKSGFYIPENVYIIGTMNDVDRGVEAMDFAIRRRFVWIEVTAEESADNMGITGLALEKMKALNTALTANGLSRAYCIGGAYFRKLENDDYNSLWKYHLEGIVYEYFRGEPDAEEKLQTVRKAFEEANLPTSEQASDTQDEVPAE